MSLCACGDVNLYLTQEKAEALLDTVEEYTATHSLPAQSGSAALSNAVTASQIPSAAAVQSAAEQTAVTQPAQASQVAAITFSDDNASLTASAQTASSSAAVGAFGTTSDPTSGTVSVIKSPTSETVAVGGSALFIAHASNATSITWMLANSNASVIINAADAPYYFSGLSVSGCNSDQLRLSNIPLSMNGWQVQAKFEGNGGPIYSGIASISVYQVQYVRCNPQPCPPRPPHESGCHCVDCCGSAGTVIEIPLDTETDSSGSSGSSDSSGTAVPASSGTTNDNANTNTNTNTSDVTVNVNVNVNPDGSGTSNSSETSTSSGDGSGNSGDTGSGEGA